jgi:hypothetical protein
MRISTHVTRLYLGVAVSLLTGCSGCGGDDVEKNPPPESRANGAESVNCECQVTPTSAGRKFGLQPVSIAIDACLPVENPCPTAARSADSRKSPGLSFKRTG